MAPSVGKTKRRRQVELAIERLRYEKYGQRARGARGVGIIQPTGPKIVESTTTVHRAHHPFKTK